MFKNTVKNLLDSALEERQDLFLIDFSISGDNSIKIIIDGDNGVLVSDCVFISRAIEHNIDREEYDFSLEIASAGAGESLSHLRQYKKNIGRTLNIKTSSESFEGQLLEVTEDYINITWKTREAKPIGKGKVTVKKEAKINFSEIEETKVKIKF